MPRYLYQCIDISSLRQNKSMFRPFHDLGPHARSHGVAHGEGNLPKMRCVEARRTDVPHISDSRPSCSDRALALMERSERNSPGATVLPCILTPRRLLD